MLRSNVSASTLIGKVALKWYCACVVPTPQFRTGDSMSLPALKSIRTALHALNPKDVRELSEKPVHVALQASSDAAYQRMEAFFLQELRPGRREASASLLTRGLNSSPLGNAAEIVVYDTGSLVPTDALVLDFEHPVRFVHETLKRYPDAGVSLARSFYPFRKPFVHSVISK